MFDIEDGYNHQMLIIIIITIDGFGDGAGIMPHSQYIICVLVERKHSPPVS